MENLNLKGVQGPEKTPKDFSVVYALDLNKDFLSLLNAERLKQFKKDFVESIRSITDIADTTGSSITNEYITSYFDTIKNPLDKINELRRVYLGMYIDLNKVYKIDNNPETQLNEKVFSEIQKALINVVNQRETPALQFVFGPNKFTIEFERNLIETRLHLVKKDLNG
jgi:hypothetical protein